MTRLTIIIPFVSSDDVATGSSSVERLEETLVSVLEHRPSHAEVVLVHDGSYTDPYELSDELSIRQESQVETICDLINLALEDCESDVAAILRPGTVVTSGWTQGILERFQDATLGSVSPLIVSKSDAESIVALGVDSSAGGARTLVAKGRSVTPRRLQAARVLGPSALGGFYRVDAVLDLGGFYEGVGDMLADVDLAATLKAAGYRSEFAADCRMIAEPEYSTAHNFQRGRQQQRFFWRHAARRGLLRSLICHPFTVARQAIGDIPHPGAVSQLLGRVLASFEWGAYRTYAEMLRSAQRPQQVSLPLPAKSGAAAELPQQQPSTRRAA